MIYIFIASCVLSFILGCFTEYGVFKKNRRRKKEEKQREYGKLLQAPEWKEKRQEILIRDNFHCRYCGGTEGLQVHHKYYTKNADGSRPKPWEYPDDALITLCRKCHSEIHKDKIKTYTKGSHR